MEPDRSIRLARWALAASLLVLAACGDDASRSAAGSTAPPATGPPVTVDLTDGTADGVLTIAGVGHRFTVDSCDLDPEVKEIAGLRIDLDFDMSAQATIDGRPVTVTAARHDLVGRHFDVFGYFIDTAEGGAARFTKIENEAGLGLLFEVDGHGAVGEEAELGTEFDPDGAVWRAGPVPLFRTEGITDSIRTELGSGSIVFTCPTA